MLATLFVFCGLTYGLAYLVADAQIFGCSTTDYVADPDDHEYIRSAGILPLRPVVLRWAFFRKQFQCYFCLGVPSGATVHLLLLLLWHVDKNVPLLSSYFMLGRSALSIALTTVLAAILGCTVCGVTDLLVRVLELKASPPDPPELEVVEPPAEGEVNSDYGPTS